MVLGELVRRLEKRMQPGKSRNGGGLPTVGGAQPSPTTADTFSFEPRATRRRIAP